MPSPLDWLDAAWDDLVRRHLARSPRRRTSPQGARVAIDGRPLLNFASNDYLGLCNDPRLAAAANDAAQQLGWGSGASPLVTGGSNIHEDCQRALAEFEGTEAALLFPSGYAANTGTIPALVGKGDWVFSDRANHASIIDGCRLSGAHVVVYDHADAAHLARLLNEARSAATEPGGRKLIVTDTLFSMDGDLAPLDALSDLARRHGAMLMVDEAHATGVLGAGGRGVCELLGVEQDVHVRVGTLSKALGGSGGFVAASRPLVHWLANRVRSYVFSTAPPAAAAAAGMAALRIVQDEPDRRATVLQRAQRLREALAGQGWDIGPAEAQIVPIVVGDADDAVRMSERLQQRGLLVPAIRPPTVPVGRSLLRVSVNYLIDDDAIGELVDALDPNSR